MGFGVLCFAMRGMGCLKPAMEPLHVKGRFGPNP